MRDAQAIHADVLPDFADNSVEITSASFRPAEPDVLLVVARRAWRGRGRHMMRRPRRSMHYDEGSTTMSELPSGSRSQNIGGTGPP